MLNHTLVNYGGDYPKIQKYRDGWLIPVNITEKTLEDGIVVYDAYQVFSPVLTEYELDKAFGGLKTLYQEDYKKAFFYLARQKRDQLIAETDWLIAKASEDGVPISQEIKDYRQTLRDIPQTYESPDDIIWPQKP